MMCSVIVWPVSAILLLILVAGILWPWQARSTKDKGTTTEHHSQRAYRSFEFFVTVSLAIYAGIGYVRFQQAGNEALVRDAMIGLGALELFVATSFSMFIVIHQGSKLRRWRDIEWAKMIFWLELWMCIAMMGLGTATWVVAHSW